MNNTQGTFIVIEGTDGSGKGTQFKLLAERLQKAGYEVALFDFPQYNHPSSYFVQQYLNGEYGSADEVGPYTGSLFYALDRFEAAKAIREALQAGKIVLANRFVGSNMAHQGTKFNNPDERRGYFIWLDNLEFEMLRIPRPSVSFVLRVPAPIAQELVDQKSERSYTDKKRDIHEADLAHLEHSVQVYDEMCELFPRDFIRIDCVRNNSLMDIDTIQRMLWERIDPLLPPPPQLEMSTPEPTIDHPDVAEAEIVPVTTETTKVEEVTAPTPTQVYPEQSTQLEISALLLQTIRTAFHAVELEPNELTRRYVVPENLNEETSTYYSAALDKILETHQYITNTLTQHLMQSQKISEAEAHAIATTITKAVLPNATVTTVTIAENSQQESKQDLLAHTLKSSQLHEFQAICEKLPTLNKPASTEQISSDLPSLATEYLPENYADTTQPIQLLQFSPRNELDITANMLYNQSSLPLQQINEAARTWSYAQKMRIFEAYSTAGKKDAFEGLQYTWDLVCPTIDFQELQACGALADAQNLQWQQATPRYGYEVPKIIEDAGLSDYFEACFDISLRLHSYLQSAGFAHEAQYATLLGHKIRWTFSTNALQLRRAFELTTSSSTHQLLQEMLERVQNAHPLSTAALLS